MQRHKDVYRLYEDSLKLLHAKKYKEATALLEEIRDNFPENLEIVARVNEWLKVSAKRTLAEEEADPRDATTWVERGVVYHNSGDYPQAIVCFKKALEMAENQDQNYMYYVLASSEAAQGNTDKALGYLKKAIQMKNELRFMARSDPDFEKLSDNSEFRELVRPQNK